MKKKNKLRLGIDINEILRLRWIQFDRYYSSEFGDEGIPKENQYVWDFFKEYKWDKTTETTKFLNENIPEDIHPQYYQIDENGNAPVDFLAFKKETKTLTALEVYNRFMYEDFCFEIFGSAPIMYKGVDLDLKDFYLKYNNITELSLVSKENYFSIPPTLFFLSKLMPRIKKIHLLENSEEIWNNVDVFITTDPDMIKNVPLGKICIKVKRPYNIDIKSNIEVLQLVELINNEDFNKLINSLTETHKKLSFKTFINKIKKIIIK